MNFWSQLTPKLMPTRRRNRVETHEMTGATGFASALPAKLLRSRIATDTPAVQGHTSCYLLKLPTTRVTMHEKHRRSQWHPKIHNGGVSRLTGPKS